MSSAEIMQSLSLYGPRSISGVAFDHGMRYDTATRILHRLITEGLVEKIDRGGVRLYRLNRKENDLEAELWDLSLSMRTQNALNRAGYRKVSDFKDVTPEQLLAINGFGEQSLAEIKRELEYFDIFLREPFLTVRALIDSLRHGPRNLVSCAVTVGYPKTEVEEALAILEDHGVVRKVRENRMTSYRLNPFFLRACDGKAA